MMSLRFVTPEAAMCARHSFNSLPVEFFRFAINSCSISPDVFAATVSPPDSQNKSDQREVDGDVTAIDQHVFERPLLEEANDQEDRNRPTNPGEQSGHQAPPPSCL